MHRYGNIEFTNKLTILTVSQIINKAREEEDKDILYRLYLAVRPNMTKENYVSFHDFYEKNKPKAFVKDTRSKDELVERAKRIQEKIKKG